MNRVTSAYLTPRNKGTRALLDYLESPMTRSLGDSSFRP